MGVLALQHGVLGIQRMFVCCPGFPVAGSLQQHFALYHHIAHGGTHIMRSRFAQHKHWRVTVFFVTPSTARNYEDLTGELHI